MVYKAEILTGIDANISRLQDRLNADLAWSENVDIFGRLYQNKKNNSDVIEAYAGAGEYSEVFLNDCKKGVIGFLVNSREIVSNEVPIIIIFSIIIPETYAGNLNHDEHIIMDCQRIIRNSGLIKASQINTDFEQIFSGTDIKRIQYRNMYPFVNFSISGTMRFVEKCLNYDIVSTFTYLNFAAAYGDDVDYNDIINVSLEVENKTANQQNCTVYFELNNSKVYAKYTGTVEHNVNYIFLHFFENIDIYVENIVKVYNYEYALISTITIAAYPEFEMFFEAVAGQMTAEFLFSAYEPCNVLWGDATSDEILVTGGYTQYTSTFAHTYSTIGLKRITFSNPKSIIVFRISETGVNAAQYYISDISQLRNIEYLYLYAINYPNLTISLASYRKATTNLDVLYHGNSIPVDDTCFRNIVYSTFFIRYAYNFNVSADKLSEIMLYARDFRIYSASIDSTSWTNRNLNINPLIIAPYNNFYFILIYCNIPVIDRNSDFGDGYLYSFQLSNLLNEAIDNALYVLLTTNNYTGASAKTINLSGQYNGRRTVASDADYAALLALGWTITCYNPNAAPYGYLYNWYVVDTDRIAPIGTHIPTVAEYNTLMTFLGGASVAGGKMKEVGLTNWNTPNTGATNSSGYTAIGTGYRAASGSFTGVKVYNMIWCREEATAANANRRYAFYNSTAITQNTIDKKQGSCLRCLLDNPAGWVAGMTITDYEGNIYQTVQIGTQVWLASDLRATKYNDGEPIPHIVDNALWTILDTPGYCSYNNT